jgi:hypothetical protein
MSDILPQRAQSRRGAQAKLIGGEGRYGLLDLILIPLPLGVEDLRERHALMYIDFVHRVPPCFMLMELSGRLLMGRLLRHVHRVDDAFDLLDVRRVSESMVRICSMVSDLLGT